MTQGFMQSANPLIDVTLLPAYFAETADCFERAVSFAGRSTSTIRVGPLPLSLEFAGPALEPYITHAFGHLAAIAANPDLRVFLWDSKSTGIAMPPPPWKWGAFVRNEVHIGDRFKIVYNGDSGSLIMYDVDARQAIFWIRDAADIPPYMTGAPLLPVMNWWMESNGCQLAHAGAVGMPDGGVLLVGRGGSGKSTTALACLIDGLEFAADDYCVLSATHPAHIHSLYCSAKLAADSRDRLPALASAIYNPGAVPSEKTLYMINRIFSERISAGFPLRAILLPRIDAIKATTLKPLRPASVLRALAPSTIFQLPGAGASALQTLASIIRGVPCFEIAVGSDLTRIPAVIRTLLEEAQLAARCGGLSDG
jgi:hypothetical protein